MSKTSDYYFDLPPELIAQTPLEQRDASRMLVLERKSGTVKHCEFNNFPSFLQSGDCLVLNNSRVLPARLLGERLPGRGNCEVLLLADKGERVWECLVKPGRRLRKGTRVSFGGNALIGEIIEVLNNGNRLVRFEYEGIFLEVLERLGEMPLPPYIRERLENGERYQTVYSKHSGSAAAPTAGLHFTPEILAALTKKGVKLVYVTLHVGLGTFRPVRVDNFTSHQMHSELCVISEEAAAVINDVKQKGGQVICIGTTSCRTIESMADEHGVVLAGSKWTDIFIYPGYKFKVMGGLLTNFHLPESTLIMLVSALAGRKKVLEAYQQAVAEGYRFFSFGDCMYVF